MPFIILGAAIVGGILILFTSDSKETKKEELPPGEKTPQGIFSQEEVRRLRRELRHQMKLKKNSTNSGGNGEI